MELDWEHSFAWKPSFPDECQPTQFRIFKPKTFPWLFGVAQANLLP